ncbi:uncharacterized protein LOC133494466 isoform X4 [Syngnathoides biaculeatus]|uniref:uncharacterized protein LOC133494466 isoform X4 n=1 Tax=Syngnathoides biaculeatus TaxID=300417 RepID=UPI002ADD94FF|nr:uncharacterized protein LOC133494466 isoform X4 [Syngnathoides biaculeatus]
MFKLCALFLALFRAHADVLFASPGDNVSLPCFFAAGAKYVCWYKQVAGDVPQIVTSFYGYVQTSRGHRLAADVGRRMAVHPGENFLHLNISHVRLSDSAEYYCGQSVLNVMRFDRGIFLLVRGAPSPTPGRTTAPWPPAGRSCSERGPGWMSEVDAFQTKREKVHVYVASTYCLLASLLASVVLNIFLTRLLWKNGRRNRRLPSDGQRSQGRVPPEDDVDDEDEDAAAALPYVALDFKKRESNKRRLRSPEDAVYAGLRLQHVD